jgi:ABC-type protease/lipase transport system fused ATPase/permease subunit
LPAGERRRFRRAPAQNEVLFDAARPVILNGIEEIITRPDLADRSIFLTLLSAGQRQRIALARALYNDPFLVVLDEPNSNLDAEGEAALIQAILGVRARGGIVIVIAHGPRVLAGVDLVMVMAQGKAQLFGPKEEVLAKIRRRPTAPAAPLKVVAEMGGATS